MSSGRNVAPVVILPAACLRLIRQAAETAYPDECCGLLVGQRGEAGDIHIIEVVAAANVAPGRQRQRFEVDPSVHFATIRRLRGTTAEIVGHYHSHPDAPGEPSAADAAAVFEAELLWLIVPVRGGVAGPMAAFFPEGDGFRQVSVCTVETTL